MDLSGVSANGAVSAVLAQQQVYTEQQAGVLMLKKALDTQTQGAMALIQSLPSSTEVVSSKNLPPNLGQNINVKA